MQTVIVDTNPSKVELPTDPSTRWYTPKFSRSEYLIDDPNSNRDPISADLPEIAHSSFTTSYAVTVTYRRMRND